MNNVSKLMLICMVLIAALALMSCGSESATAVPPTVAPTLAPVATAVPVQPTAVSVQPTVPPATTAPTAVPPTAIPPTAAPPTVAPTSGTQMQAVPTFVPAAEWKDPSPDKFTREDVDYIFPPGRGQDLVFQGCTGCHNWVPMVLAGYDRDAWTQNKINHEQRATALSKADYDYLYEYLIQTWPPGRPVPDNIPQDLLDQWTSY